MISLIQGTTAARLPVAVNYVCNVNGSESQAKVIDFNLARHLISSRSQIVSR
jgi:hypothetical protein